VSRDESNGSGFDKGAGGTGYEEISWYFKKKKNKGEEPTLGREKWKLWVTRGINPVVMMP